MGTYSFLLNYSIYSTKRFRTEVVLKNLDYVFSYICVISLGKWSKAGKIP